MNEEEMMKQEWIEELETQRKEDKKRLKKEAKTQHRAHVVPVSSSVLANPDVVRHSKNSVGSKKKTRKKIRIKRLLNGRVSPKAHKRFMDKRRIIIRPKASTNVKKEDGRSIISSSRRVRKK